MKKMFLCIGIMFCLINAAYAAGDIEAGKKKAMTCYACHGPTGNTTVLEWPKLAQQHASYIGKELIDYREGKKSGRYDVTMTPNATVLSDQDIEDLSVYFASLKGNYGEAKPQYVERGEILYRGGDSVNGIPACMACHGPAGSGIGSAIFPRLSGQNPDYVIKQLKAFRSGERHNDLNEMMQLAAKNLTDDDINALANYIYGLHAADLPPYP